MSGIMMRRRVGPHRAGGGGGGGCGVVLTTPYDDNFDCGSSPDTAGTRFSGAYPWASVPGGTTQSGGQLLMTQASTGGFSPVGPVQDIQAADLALDWAFETDCTRDAGGGFAPLVGLRLYESATGKDFHAGFADVFGVLFVVGDTAGMGTYAATGIAALGGKVEVARISGNLRVRYDIGSGWVTSVASLAQTTPFTVRPNKIQCVNAPRRNSFSTDTTHSYFHKTA